MRLSLFFALFLTAGCSTYKIPVQTENHPASLGTATCEIHLSPVLEIGEPVSKPKPMVHDHAHH